MGSNTVGRSHRVTLGPGGVPRRARCAPWPACPWLPLLAAAAAAAPTPTAPPPPTGVPPSSSGPAPAKPVTRKRRRSAQCLRACGCGTLAGRGSSGRGRACGHARRLIGHVAHRDALRDTTFTTPATHTRHRDRPANSQRLKMRTRLFGTLHRECSWSRVARGATRRAVARVRAMCSTDSALESARECAGARSKGNIYMCQQAIRVPPPSRVRPPQGRRALKIERLPQKPWLGGGKKKKALCC